MPRWLPLGRPDLGESSIRRVVASGLVAIGVLSALLAGVFAYVDQHFHTAEQFVENTSSLAEDAEVRERLFEGFRAEVISIADGDLSAEGLEAPVVDDSAGGLAGADDTTPVTDERIERDQAIEAVLLDVFDSELWRDVLVDGLFSVQSDIVRSAELEDAELLRDKGPVTLDVRRLYQRIYPALAADERTADITERPVPPEFGSYPLADRDTTVDAVWWVIDSGPRWRGLSVFLAVVCFIATIALAERRPSRAIQYGAGVAGLALVSIVVIYIVRAIVPVLAGGGGSAGTVASVYSANIGPLTATMIRLLILGGVIAGLGAVAKLIWPDDWLYGQVDDGRGVQSIRRRKGSAEPEPVPQAAAVPGAYPPYGQPPYGGFLPPPGWGTPWPQQGYAPNPWQQYPAGPYAHPAAAPASVNTGQPTIPVAAVGPESIPTGEHPSAAGVVAPSGDGLRGDGPASDAARVVAKVVASTEVEAIEVQPTLSPTADMGDADGADSADDPWDSDDER